MKFRDRSLHEMKLSDLGEFGLISQIQKMSRAKESRAAIGIGDDAAALDFSSRSAILATTDMLVEGVHFDLSYTGYNSLGWKSAAVNISDIAAMGGLPRFALTALAIPGYVRPTDILQFYRGFNALCKKNGVELVGGDTCASLQGLIISVTMLGEAPRKKIITRSGARPGDRIFVTGTLGDSAAGMEILRAEVRGRKPEARKLTEKHLRPVPRIDLSRKIVLSGAASSMIDISDGLSSDLGHICEQSGVGAVIYQDRMPYSSSLLKLSTKLTKKPLWYAMSGGEDYELLFTVPKDKINLLKSIQRHITEIGEIIKSKSMHLVDTSGNKTPLQVSGYNHFTPSKSNRKAK